ncbi:uncharacterized protein LOC116113579 [Pistacia vera]|uniref:uncharacterized protein LOC116113579 n=1 Tax=Pistacia vera TaxID=55513 RepID=UPI001263A83E|nr:uncharacterized protein LOC116113579 [Pistacia vera]
MGNCLPTSISKKKSKGLPIETTFKLPSPIPTWPSGEGFATGTIDLGYGLQVRQISSFNKVWSTKDGGPDNIGATFFEPSSIPEGFFMLGHYAQPNNTRLFGWVLVAKDDTDTSLKKPLDYSLVWSSESLNINQEGIAYVWLPTPPDGYKPVGHLITNSPVKPSLEKIRCVRSDLTDQCETDTWIWGPGKDSNASGFNIFGVTPTNRGIQGMGVCVGTFAAKNNNSPLSIACLKNFNFNSNLSSMPNPLQIEALLQTYSPYIYFHPDEKYLPSSVSWFFDNGALLYKKGEESKPILIDSMGSNLPQGGSDDGHYWLDLPVDDKAKERVEKGDLQNAQVYLHIKPMLGATFTDIAIWVFYPFNGPARAKVEFINIPLGKIGEHVGDWEHLTLRVSNFDGMLRKVYFSEHSGGSWVNASELEFQGGNKVVTYASLNGHAMYPKPGLVLQGNGRIGIRNDTAKSKMFIDTGNEFSLAAAEYLGSTIIEPPWLNYFRKWGPKISYDIAEEIRKIEKVLPGKLKPAFDKFVKSLPNEILGEEGPTGPKLKRNWSGDEV